MTLELALDELVSFTPADTRPSESDADYVRWEESAKQLICLAARFGESLRDVEAFYQLQESTEVLEDYVGQDSEYEKARREVVPLLTDRLVNQHDRDGEEQEFGKLFSSTLAYGLLPVQIEASLIQAEFLLGQFESGSDRELVRHWRDELWKVSKQVEIQNLWGRQLMLMCETAFNPDFDRIVDIELHKDLLLCFRSLPPATRAIQSAARHIIHDVPEEFRVTAGDKGVSGATLQSKDSKPANEPVANGPEPPNLFHFGGRRVELGRKCFKLIDAVWHADEHRIEELRLCVAVWDDEEKANRALPSAIFRLNNAFLKAKIPLTMGRKNGYVILSNLQ